MKEICVLSGKGGTGKTGLTAALATISSNAIYADLDVDAPDLHLIFQPTIEEEFIFQGAKIAQIHPDKCNNCGLCKKECRFDAIHYKKGGGLEINPFKCEGCRLCERICPAMAIESKASLRNKWYSSNTRFGSLVHAKMKPGEENSGKLVTRVRKAAKEKALLNGNDYLLCDGPPGIGCSTIASVTGTDAVVIVTEPSKSGFHDAVRLIDLIKKFNIEMYAVINKFDLNPEFTSRMETFFRTENIKLIGKIPFDHKMIEAVVHHQSIIEYEPKGNIANLINRMWTELTDSLSLKTCNDNRKLENQASL